MTCCPICNCYDAVITKTKFKSIVGFSPSLAICPACDHWFVSPMPSYQMLDLFYTSILSMDSKSYLRQYKKKKLTIFNRVISGVDLPPSPVVIEIGPGPIGILSILPKFSRYIAVEPGAKNNKSLFKAAEFHKIRLLCVESISDLPCLGVKADLIFANASFEHMISPRDSLNELINSAKSSAYVVIGLPSRSLEFPDEELVRKGLYETINYCSTHLHSFGNRSASLLLESCGLEIVSSATTMTAARMRSYNIISSAWKDFTTDRTKSQSFKWHLGFLRKLIYLYIFKILDRTPSGDDRCEILYICRIQNKGLAVNQD